MLEQMARVFGKSADAALRYQFQTNMMKQRLLDREERERLIEEVCAEVLSRISIQIKAEAIDQLRDMLNGLGR